MKTGTQDLSDDANTTALNMKSVTKLNDPTETSWNISQESQKDSVVFSLPPPSSLGEVVGQFATKEASIPTTSIIINEVALNWSKCC